MLLELNGSLASIVDEALVSVISGDLYTCLDAKMENFWKTSEVCISQITSVFFQYTTILTAFEV